MWRVFLQIFKLKLIEKIKKNLFTWESIFNLEKNKSDRTSTKTKCNFPDD